MDGIPQRGDLIIENMKTKPTSPVGAACFHYVLFGWEFSFS